MIASLFKKSTPFNYSLVILAALLFFFIYQSAHSVEDAGIVDIGFKFGLLAFIYASLFISNFIVKKNGLSRDSAYTVLFFLLLLMYFPALFDDPNLILSNFFILLALRRLLSLHSLKSTKEKVFDASLWIFVAALFHFWSIMYIALVFISILFHVSRDYRNWLLPFLAFGAIFAAASLYSVVFDPGLMQSLWAQTAYDFRMDYLTSSNENFALGVYVVTALFFTASMILSLTSRPMVLQSSYKKIIASFFIGTAIYLISPEKTNHLLIFTFAPLAFMATSFIEMPMAQLKREITVALFVLCAVILYFLQL